MDETSEIEQSESSESRTEGDLVEPSLHLQEFEGRVHSYEGMLSRKTKLKKWKRRWFRVTPGRRQEHLFYLAQSKTTKHKKSDMEKRIVTIPKLKPNLHIETISMDPTSQMFTAFNVYDSKTKELLATFRADDIVQQRNFMAALSGKGPGLFTQHYDDTLEEASPESPSGLSSSTSCSELLVRQQSYDCMSNNSLRGYMKVPSYATTMVYLPKEYYYSGLKSNTNAGEDLTQYPGDMLPMCSAADLPESEAIKSMHRRKYKDKFLPPYGLPVHSPVSIGYGSEVGLKEHQQAVWDPSRDIYFFLDHSTKTSFLDDPRPHEHVKPTVARKEMSCKHVHNIHQLPEAFRHSSTTTSTTAPITYFPQKPSGLVLTAAGSHGQEGKSGQMGKKGEDGSHGDIGIRGDGKDGERGLNGDQGENGTAGKAGSNGGNLAITLTGSVSKLHINVNNSLDTVASLGDESCDEIVFVDCRGGNGGHGGRGGDGGCGGAGGDGGEGTHKGDGGHGGDGGMGGHGGNGGSGGNAGDGGNCVIQAADPSLLMLVEVDCRAGVPGAGVQGGRGGEGGARGFGGQGATWEESYSTSSGQHTLKSLTGMRGKPGMSGASGTSGTTGLDGSKGTDGRILWMITSENGEVLHTSTKCYDLVITHYDVTPGNNDDIYEPNQQVNVSNVNVVNSGGLPLPSGAKLSFPSTETVRFEPQVYVLPELQPNESLIVPETFRGRVFDQETPNSPEPLNTEAHIMSRIELLGRSFEQSIVKKTLPVSYPLRFSFALSRKNMSCGEISTLDIGIENVSQISYGSGGGGGSVYLRVHMDTRLIPLGIHSQNHSSNGVVHESLSYAITFDPNTPDSMFIHIKEIQPGETLMVPIVVLMESMAELCDTCVWQVDLYLKGKLIEYKSQEIRVSPAYTPPANSGQLGDILMIINKHLTREQFVLLQRIFTILSVNVDYWDSSHRKLTDNTPPSFEASSVSTDLEQCERNFPNFYHTYKGKTILYPHCHLQDIPSKSIIEHLMSEDDDTPYNQPSNMLLFLASEFPKSLEDYNLHQQGDAQLLKHLCSSQKRVQVPQGAYSGYHVLPPGTVVSTDWTIKRAEKNAMKKMEQEMPSQAVVLMNHTKSIKHSGGLRYSYGVLDVRRCPLLRSCNFQCVDGAGGSMMSMGVDDPLLTPSSREFPMASKFGQAFLAIMYAIPLKCKLTILKKSENKSSPNFVKFHLPNDFSLNKQELAAICIAKEVADELLNCSGSISRLKYVLEDLEAYIQTAGTLCSSIHLIEVVSQMLDLVMIEASERKRTIPYPIVAQAANEMQRLCCSWSTSENVVKNTKTSISKKLPLLKILQDSSHMLRSHQLTVAEDCYSVCNDMT